MVKKQGGEIWKSEDDDKRFEVYIYIEIFSNVWKHITTQWQNVTFTLKHAVSTLITVSSTTQYWWHHIVYPKQGEVCVPLCVWIELILKKVKQIYQSELRNMSILLNWILPCLYTYIHLISECMYRNFLVFW